MPSSNLSSITQSNWVIALTCRSIKTYRSCAMDSFSQQPQNAWSEDGDGFDNMQLFDLESSFDQNNHLTADSFVVVGQDDQHSLNYSSVNHHNNALSSDSTSTPDQPGQMEQSDQSSGDFLHSVNQGLHSWQSDMAQQGQYMGDQDVSSAAGGLSPLQLVSSSSYIPASYSRG